MKILIYFSKFSSHEIAATVPPKNMLQSTKDLIAYAVEAGHLEQNYTIFGHRQVRDTECPGGALFNEIKNWPHFENTSKNSI